MLEEVHDAVCVEYVSAGEAGARLGAELCRVADCAELVLVHTLKVANLLSTGCIEAWEALAFLGDAFACMATSFMSLLTKLDFRLIFLFFFLVLNRLLDLLGGSSTTLHHRLRYLLH